MHPLHAQHRAVKFYQDFGVSVTAYAPFGSPGMNKDDSLFENPTIVEVAKKHGKTPS